MRRRIPEVSRFHITTPEELASTRWQEIVELRRQHYERIFSAKGRTLGEIQEFLGRTTRQSWSNANKSPHLGDSRHARQQVVAAVRRDDSLAGYVSVTDNASSTLPAPLSSIEKFAKLHVPVAPLQERRYVFLREVLAPNRMVAGMLAYLALRDRLPVQQVSAFPYTEETGLQNLLSGWSLRPVKGEPATEIAAFGEPEVVGTTEQRQWVGESTQAVIEAIAGGPDMQGALARADALVRVGTSSFES